MLNQTVPVARETSEVDNNETPQQDQNTISEKQDTYTKQQNDKEENLRRMREKYEEEKRRDSERISKLEEEIRRKESLADDDIVEGRQFNSVKEELKALKQQQAQFQQQQVLDMHRSKLKSDLPDFDAIVNPKTLKKLEEYDPILYKSLDTAPDFYTAGKLAHNLIKNSGILDQQENNERIDKNLSKPSVGNSGGALSNAESFRKGYSDDEMAEQYRTILRNQQG